MSALDAKIDEIWVRYDADGSGGIDKSEAKVFFDDLVTSSPELGFTKDDFDAWFKAVDADASDVISKDEMKQFFLQIQH